MSKGKRDTMLLLIFVLVALLIFASVVHAGETESGQEVMTADEYLKQNKGKWFLTGKKEYTVQAMMVSKETVFHNDLEVTDYSASDDGETVVLQGTRGEMWAAKLSKVIDTYIKPDGSTIRKEDFSEKDSFTDIIAIPSPDSNFAMFVPKNISVTVETAWGDILHTNLPNASHGEGDFLVCRTDEEGNPDLADIWVINGELFPDTYDTTHMMT